MLIDCEVADVCVYYMHIICEVGGLVPIIDCEVAGVCVYYMHIVCEVGGFGDHYRL